MAETRALIGLDQHAERCPDMNHETVKRFFDDQIQTAQKARKMYQDGAAERTGIQRESYLAYADAQATRETFLREIYTALLDLARTELGGLTYLETLDPMHAAAPELLAALKDCCAALGGTVAHPNAIPASALAAIAKAEGR